MSRDPLARGRALLDDAKRQNRRFEGRLPNLVNDASGPVDPALSAASGSLARDYRSLQVIYDDSGLRAYDEKLDCFTLRAHVVFPAQQKMDVDPEGQVLSRKPKMLRF